MIWKPRRKNHTIHSHFINTNIEMHKNTQKYTNSCILQSSLSISISENIRLNPGIEIKANHENSNKPRDMFADVDLISRFMFYKVKIKQPPRIVTVVL
jgi:hypothetical protein